MANPLLKQSLRLLQIPTATLDQRIKEELEANPALEESEDQEEVIDVDEQVEDNYGNGEAKDVDAEPEPEAAKEEEFELDDYLTEYIEDDPSSYKLRSDNYNIEEEDKSIPIAVENSFHEYLEMQLGLLELKDEREYTIAGQIISLLLMI